MFKKILKELAEARGNFYADAIKIAIFGGGGMTVGGSIIASSVWPVVGTIVALIGVACLVAVAVLISKHKKSLKPANATAMAIRLRMSGLADSVDHALLEISRALEQTKLEGGIIHFGVPVISHAILADCNYVGSQNQWDTFHELSKQLDVQNASIAQFNENPTPARKQALLKSSLQDIPPLVVKIRREMLSRFT